MELPTCPTISIVVVNYRTRDMTMECLRSIMRETNGTSYEILLVDNASDDGIVEAIGREMPRVQLIPLSSNVGFARANNIAAEQAKGRFLLLLNPDTVVLDGAVDKLISFALERPKAKVWGGQSFRGHLRPPVAQSRKSGARRGLLVRVAKESYLAVRPEQKCWPRR